MGQQTGEKARHAIVQMASWSRDLSLAACILEPRVVN
jgi:hypothetical protein